jgi:hypothetical protein
MRILFNALGICSSGGITVLDKSLYECSESDANSYIIICNVSENINTLIDKYKNKKRFKFKIIENRGFFYRLYYENIVFKKIIKEDKINLIYNFSGSSQRFLKVNKLVKIQNLLFFSKNLDYTYFKNNQIILWLKQVYLRRIIFKIMMSESMSLEIQSYHVEDCINSFLNTSDKNFYIKSDVDIFSNTFLKPKHYDFSKKIKFLYVVGPHFEYVHKNIQDFIGAMLVLNENELDFEINITLTKDQLTKSTLWNPSLNSRTNFFGYINDQEKMVELFSENTILISTSIIETLGLHVIEGVKSGVIVITPNEEYTKAVYGGNVSKYRLFDKNSLVSTIMNIINFKDSHNERILSLQEDLMRIEAGKFSSIVDVFDEVVNVQK